MVNGFPVDLKTILINVQTIAVVGLSPKSSRPSNRVAAYLMEAGYTVIPVNPGQSEILGQICYPNLSSVPIRVDLVNIFRKPEDVPPVVEEAIGVKAKAIWMQLGIIHEEAADRARKAGLWVVMDRCISVDHRNLF